MQRVVVRDRRATADEEFAHSTSRQLARHAALADDLHVLFQGGLAVVGAQLPEDKEARGRRRVPGILALPCRRPGRILPALRWRRVFDNDDLPEQRAPFAFVGILELKPFVWRGS